MYDMGPTALLPPRRKCVLWIFITEKNPSTSAGFEPATLGPTASLLTARPQAATLQLDIMMPKLRSDRILVPRVSFGADLLQLPHVNSTVMLTVHIPSRSTSGWQCPAQHPWRTLHQQEVQTLFLSECIPYSTHPAPATCNWPASQLLAPAAQRSTWHCSARCHLLHSASTGEFQQDEANVGVLYFHLQHVQRCSVNKINTI
jgi:hypothetical protein